MMQSLKTILFLNITILKSFKSHSKKLIFNNIIYNTIYSSIYQSQKIWFELLLKF